MHNFENINEIDDCNSKNKNSNNLNNKKDDKDSEFNVLFDSKVDINTLKIIPPNAIKPQDLNLDKELAQSKRNIIVNDEKKFLHNKKWNYLDKTKIKEMDNKVDLIYKEMNKRQLEILVGNINRCDLQRLYIDFNPREVIMRIGTLSSLNYLIETTYNSQPDFISKMFEDKKKLEPYIYKFRNILGDGDCFYRGLIFYLLENIVLTNNIMHMKELLILFDEKINTKNPLIKKREYLGNNFQKLNISIVSQILYHLIKKMEEGNTDLTYQILLKVFLYCQEFDTGIVYFTRYLLFEYILQNEDKIYSRENQVDIGCLLPEFFCNDKGDKMEYFFENFYSQQLMKQKEFAERISIYIAPFVFNCNINILIYDYGEKSFIQEKKLLGEKIEELEICLLFRKAHYDIYYKKNFYDKFYQKLDTLTNILEEICYLNDENQKEIEEKIKLENKKQKENKEKNDNNEKIIAFNQNNTDYNRNNNNNYNNNSNNTNNDVNFYNNNNRNDNNYKNNNSNYKSNNNYNNSKDKNYNNNLPICLQCQKPYNHKINAFMLCNNCLLNELKSQTLSFYFEYITRGNNLQKYDAVSYILQKHSSISVQTDIPLSNIISNSGFNFKEIFLEVRKNMCLYCGFNISNDNFYIELPCQCRLCKKDCFSGYLKIIQKKLEIRQDKSNGNFFFLPLDCCCGFKYTLQSILYMINEIEKRNLNKEKEIYFDFIKRYWKWKCTMCGIYFNPYKSFCRLIFKDEQIEAKLSKKLNFEHLICELCANKYRIKDSNSINCNFCKLKHKKDTIKGVDQNNENTSNCIII